MKRALFVAALMVFGVVVAAAPASAAPTDPFPEGTLVACGRGSSVGPNNCMSLQQAIDAATQQMGTVTILMTPGEYCPPTMPALSGPDGVHWSRLEFVGVGLAAYGPDGPPSGLVGPEAELTSFEWDNSCPSATALFTLSGPATETVTFRNLSFVGNIGGPTYGLHDDLVNFSTRDVIFDGLNTGLYWHADDGMVNNTAFVNNTVDGVQFAGAEGSIDESTFAGNGANNGANNGAGIDVTSTAFINLRNDTITHNAIGYHNGASGTTVAVNSTLNANNTIADCSGNFPGADWETGNFNDDNLVGGTCTHTATGDLVWDGTTIQAVDENGGPTPSVLPPIQAQAHGDLGLCASAGSIDQREFLFPSANACDIGAVQTGASGTPVAGADPAPGTLDFGTVPQGQTSTVQINVSNAGGDALYMNGASISGAGFSIDRDGCRYQVMIPAAGANGCYVQVNASTADDHSTITGTLKVKTSVGKLTYHLTATGGAPLLPPTNVHAVPGNKKATLSWTPPDNGGPAVADYQIALSTDGGQNFSFEGYADSSPTTISGLTNGTPYEFEVASQDADGHLSDWSAPSNSVTPHSGADTSALTAPGSATVQYGANATVKGSLTDSDTGEPIAAATVKLLSRKSPSGTFSNVGSGTTNASGKVSVTLQPKVNAEYEWKYLGDSAHHAVTSSSATIEVAQVVVAQLVKASVKTGSAATVWGTVAPDGTGQTVQLQKKVGGHWVTKSTATIKKQKLPDGTTAKGFLLTITPTAKGTVSLRVRRASTTSNATGLSATLTLQVT